MRKVFTIMFAAGIFFGGMANGEEPAAPSKNEQVPPKPVPQSSPLPPWAAEPERTQEPPSPDRFYNEFFHMLLVLGLILAVLLGVTWFLKRMLNMRFEQGNATSSIKIIERRVLTPKTAIYVIEIFEKRFAIAESHNGITSLGELKEEPLHPSEFEKIMQKKT